MDNNLQEKVVTRFAPSPTGFIHVGGVRTAIFAYLFAKKHNGTFILRIEDTDKAREVSGSIDHIIESLRWIGIDWDYGPDKENPFGSTIQSERLDTYLEWAKKLVDKGLAYTDPYTEEEVEAFRKKAEEEKRPFLYRNYRPKETINWELGKTLRFKVTNLKRYTWTDEVRGELSAGEEALDDFVLIKADGYPTYNFAHIIDDLNMGVTHIFRSDEFISSTPRFLSLYDALEIKHPIFVTLPPILSNNGKKKLSKRDGAKDILDYKKEGYLPEALFNFLAFLGWHPVDERELFTKEDLINIFDIHRIQKGGALFDEKKLDWINREHIRKLKNSQKVSFISDFIPEKIKSLPYFSEEMVLKSAHTIVDHIEKGLDVSAMALSGELSYIFDFPKYEPLLLLWKSENTVDTKRRLVEVLSLIEKMDEETFKEVEKIKEAVFPYAEKEGKGQVLWPLRVSLTGLEKSPDPFVVMHIIGKDRTISCINKAIEMLQ